jgi:hypothetical protein
MKWDVRHIAHALDGEVSGRDSVNAPGPGHSRRDRSLSVRLDPTAPDGFLIYSHAGDDWKACRDHVRNRLGQPRWKPGDEQQRTVPAYHVDKWDLAAIEAEANERPRPWTEDEAARIAAARNIWAKSRDPRGTLAERYLREQRKLQLPEDIVGRVLRFHPACPWRNVHPACPWRNESTGRRRMLGVVQGTAIKFDEVGETLAIGEGIDSVMAARQLGFAPAWALGSVGAISFFPLIDAVKRLVILGEPGEANERAIKLCGTRWHRAGRRVRVVMPGDGLSDLSDALMMGAA